MAANHEVVTKAIASFFRDDSDTVFDEVLHDVSTFQNNNNNNDKKTVDPAQYGLTHFM